MNVVVAVITYERPEGLRRLLGSLGPAIAQQPASVLVVDNGPRPSVADVADEFPHLDIVVVHEPRAGIVAARNRALGELDGSDLDAVVFVDDDEWVAPHWLAALVAAVDTHGADLVAGPVEPVIDGAAPDWLRLGGFFDRARHPTGTVVPTASTANLLLTAHALRTLPERFDERFSFTGGSDTVLTALATARGLRIVWADDALVHEEVGPGRASPRWLLRRSFRLGNTFVRADLVSRDHAETTGRGSPGRVRRGLQSAGLVGRAAGRAVRAAVTGDRATAFGHLRDVFRGAGGVAAAVGLRYRGYRRDRARDAQA